MEDRHQLQPLAPNPIGDDIRCIWHDEFARAEHPPGPAHLGVRLEQIYGFENAAGDESCILP